jgi:lipopolysaccharide transport system ATP-binding protein
MSDIILKAENISKQYRLGLVGTGTIAHDLNRFWHRVRGKEDPYLQLGAVNDRSASASSDYVWALQDINFEVKRGEILGIIGKNGAGKSTLLKILSRVTSPTTGSIKTGGRIASLLEVGTGMHPELTGRENIFLNGAILGMNKTEISSKIDEIIEFSGCQMYIDTPVKRYSSGMRVRLGFAVAAFLEPDILVVDEVLAVGDAEFQKKAIGKMQDISNTNGRTVLFVSHDMTAIQNLCQRVLVLKNGGIVISAPTNEAISEYLEDSQNLKPVYKNNNFDYSLNGIFSIEILTSQGNYFHNQFEPLSVRFELNIAQPIQDAALSYQIVDFMDNNIIHELLLNKENEFGTVQGRTAIISKLNTLSLYPGNYKLNVFFADNGLKINYNKLIEVCGFEIIQTQKRDYYWEKGSAIYKEINTEWQIN